MDKPLLSVRDLKISFHGAAGTFDAVRGVSFDLGREKLGIVGESGSGKSMTGRAIMRLTPPQQPSGRSASSSVKSIFCERPKRRWMPFADAALA